MVQALDLSSEGVFACGKSTRLWYYHCKALGI